MALATGVFMVLGYGGSSTSTMAVRIAQPMLRNATKASTRRAGNRRQEDTTSSTRGHSGAGSRRRRHAVRVLGRTSPNSGTREAPLPSKEREGLVSWITVLLRIIQEFLAGIFQTEDDVTLGGNPTTERTLCSGNDPNRFNICVIVERTSSTTDPTWVDAFFAAIDRWESVITGDLPPIDSTYTSPCTTSPTDGIVDDLAICAIDPKIDGRGGVLGSAGPNYIRSPFPPGLPAAGNMKFDSDDINDLISKGTFQNVIIHEVGHVLGLGTLWDNFGLINLQDDAYDGVHARTEWQKLGCGDDQPYPPVETEGSAGTKFKHWSETCMDNELMTGFIGTSYTPLSSLTIASLEDLGYVVDYSKADIFTPSSSCCDTGAVIDNPNDREIEENFLLSDEGYDAAVAYGLNEIALFRNARFQVDDIKLQPVVDVLFEENNVVFGVIVELDDSP